MPGMIKGSRFCRLGTGAQVFKRDVLTGADTNGVIDSTLRHSGGDRCGRGDFWRSLVVYLPEGTYRVSPVAGRSRSLLISKSNVVLRGAGGG